MTLGEFTNGWSSQKLFYMSTDQDQLLVDAFKFYYDHPVELGHDLLGIEKFESYQQGILEALVSNDMVACRSGHGIGKTFVAAVATLWFLVTRPQSKVITTAPTFRQVRSVLWPEIKARVRGSIFYREVEVLSTQLRIDSDWFAIGASSDSPVNMQGYHSPTGVLFIVDEGAGVGDDIFEAIDGALTGAEGKLLVLGNPASPVGKFYRIFTIESEYWKTFHVSSVDSPLVSERWIEQRKRIWGEDSPVYKARVLGDFPDEGEDTLIPLSTIEAAVSRYQDAEEGDGLDKLIADETPKALGVDVARFGAHKTAFCLIDHGVVKLLTTTSKKRLTETSGRAIDLIKENSIDHVAIDDTGLGGGVVDTIFAEGYEIIACNAGSRPAEDFEDFERFLNLGSQMYWYARERFIRGLVAVPDDTELVGQISQVRYSYTASGKIQVDKHGFRIDEVDKEKKRRQRSPDKFDALVLALWAARQTTTIDSFVVEETSDEYELTASPV